MLIAPPWIFLTALLIPHGVPVTERATKSTPHFRPIATAYESVMDSVDTLPEPPLVLLTEELMARYLAVQNDIGALLEQRPGLLDSVRVLIPVTVLPYPSATDTDSTRNNFQSFADFKALAAKDPAVAAVFKAHHFLPEQYTPLTISIRKAQKSLWLDRGKLPIKHPESVAGKNARYIKTHCQQINPKFEAGAGVLIGGMPFNCRWVEPN